ncbi:hypothetical protein [Priestia filamentosa]|uniref:hypothetical protein n=1 Tax=Priestia filamentosa TaxID=1402861 RepID=UPI000A0899B3|nr:hypothetical protein [Priestia filamentosa]OXS69848.1 hypothetical protein B1B01_12925 [Priestia filamentosa]SMF37136.1 hypothetical protein SAMN06296056_1021165 [Priestia filamentosa]
MKKLEYMIPYLILGTVGVLNLIILYAIMESFQVDIKGFFTAFIGFFGSIIGGLLTLIGVQMTLKHKDREAFLDKFAERHLFINSIYNELKPYINYSTIYRFAIMDQEAKCSAMKQKVQEFMKVISENKSNLYKFMDYEDLELVDIYEKFLEGSLRKQDFDEETADACYKNMQNIIECVRKSKEKLEIKYRSYKKRAI